MSDMDTSKYEEMAIVLKGKMESLMVVDTESANLAEAMEKTAKDNAKMLTAHMETQIKDAHAKHKKLTTLRDRLVSPFIAVAKEARSKRIAWTQEEQRKAAEIMRKAQAEAAKQAEEERLAEASVMEAEGDSEGAEAILEAPIEPVFVPVVEAPKVKGAKELWSANITDCKAMFKALPDSPFMPDLGSDELAKLATLLKLTKHAVSLKTNFKLAGVTVSSKTV